MDTRWRPVQGSKPPAGANPNGAATATTTATATATGGDWRAQIQPEGRSRVVNKITETLTEHLPVSVPEGLKELRKIAVRFEEKIYAAATSQHDYLRKISLKMLSLEINGPVQPETRNLNVKMMMDTLMKHLLASGPEELNELQRIACRFEEKIYTTANNKSDYSRKITLKMRSLEMMEQHAPRNAK